MDEEINASSTMMMVSMGSMGSSSAGSCVSVAALSALDQPWDGLGAGYNCVNSPDEQEQIELDALMRIRQTASAIRAAL